MDSYEATRVVFTRIQSIDPEYASKIMGLLLIQDQGEKEMIRLAFGPESLLHSVILKARKQLAISTRSVWTKVEDHAAGAHHHLSLDLVSPNGPHRRSSSVNDVCLYFARGYCKNGGSCRFTHGEAATVGSFDMMEHCQQRLLMAGSPKSINFLLQQQSDSPRMIGGDDMNKFGRMGSRQIYLTFPADSTFREEDVSNYFSIYGPVQDVRIPYQQKRMFGFVTFVYAETVNLILAKGNPHFVCDARVLVKPYKEKGKVPEKFRKPLEGFDSAREPFDLNLDLLWRKKLEEQADLQHAIKLQNRRIMDLQLLDVKRSPHHQRALSTGAAIPSPTCYLNHPSVFGSRSSSTPDSEDGLISKMASVTISGDDPLGVNLDLEKHKETLELKDEISDGKSIPNNEQDIDLPESLEHNLPDNLFASPKASGNYQTVFSNDDITLISTSNSNLMTSPLLPATSTLDLASLKSCYFQFPRFSTGHGAIGM